MGVKQRRHAGEILVIHRVTSAPQLLNEMPDLHGVPHQHGVGQKAQAARLVHDLRVVAGAEGALVGEEQPFGEAVAVLASIELEVDDAPESLVMDVAQWM